VGGERDEEAGFDIRFDAGLDRGAVRNLNTDFVCQGLGRDKTLSGKSSVPSSKMPPAQQGYFGQGVRILLPIDHLLQASSQLTEHAD
jgi:hypothetical protein